MADGEVLYEIRGDDSNIEKDLDEAQKKVEQSTKKSADKAEKIYEDAAEDKKKIQEDVTGHHEQENDRIVDDDKKTGEERTGNESKVGEKLKSIAGGTAKAIGASMVAVGAAAVAIGTKAVSSANDLDQAMNQFAASTGKGTEETERYQKVLEEVYKNNYGESFEDIGMAMADVTKQLGDLDDASLQNVTESAFALRDTFGYEIPSLPGSQGHDGQLWDKR